jgi:hypothetical protein
MRAERRASKAAAAIGCNLGVDEGAPTQRRQEGIGAACFSGNAAYTSAATSLGLARASKPVLSQGVYDDSKEIL